MYLPGNRKWYRSKSHLHMTCSGVQAAVIFCRGFPVDKFKGDRLGLVIAFWGLGIVLGRPLVSQTDYTEDGETFGESQNASPAQGAVLLICVSFCWCSPSICHNLWIRHCECCLPDSRYVRESMSLALQGLTVDWLLHGWQSHSSYMLLMPGLSGTDKLCVGAWQALC